MRCGKFIRLANVVVILVGGGQMLLIVGKRETDVRVAVTKNRSVEESLHHLHHLRRFQ